MKNLPKSLLKTRFDVMDDTRGSGLSLFSLSCRQLLKELRTQAAFISSSPDHLHPPHHQTEELGAGVPSSAQIKAQLNLDDGTDARLRPGWVPTEGRACLPPPPPPPHWLLTWILWDF